MFVSLWSNSCLCFFFLPPFVLLFFFCYFLSSFCSLFFIVICWCSLLLTTNVCRCYSWMVVITCWRLHAQWYSSPISSTFLNLLLVGVHYYSLLVSSLFGIPPSPHFVGWRVWAILKVVFKFLKVLIALHFFLLFFMRFFNKVFHIFSCLFLFLWLFVNCVFVYLGLFNDSCIFFCF